MSPPRWIPYAAATVISLVLAISYFAFPNEKTRIVTNRVVVSPYAKYLPLGSETIPVQQLSATAILLAQCETSGSRKGMEVSPRAGDVVVRVCTLLRQSLNEPTS